MKAVREKFALLACAIALSGCVSYASVPDGAVFGIDYAEATFTLGVNETVGFGSATVQEYRLSATPDYHDGETVKVFTWAAKDPKTHLLQAGENIYIMARMRDLAMSNSISCTVGSSFTPQANTRYNVYLRRLSHGCRLEIREQDTGREPADLERVRFPVED